MWPMRATLCGLTDSRLSLTGNSLFRITENRNTYKWVLIRFYCFCFVISAKAAPITAARLWSVPLKDKPAYWLNLRTIKL